LIRILVSLGSDRRIEEIEAEGHGLAPAGGASAVCAAVTVLIRTLAETLSERRSIDCDLQAPREGVLHIRIRAFAEEDAEWLRGVSDFMMTGLADLTDDSDEVLVTIKIKGS
jgi:uncharacterized protein YsxB (DUF464 family)